MKSLKLFAASILLAWSVGQNAMADAPKYKDVQIGLTDVYVPGGFDSEADAYVVANGIFPNGCYKWKNAEVSNVTDYTHEIRSTASVSQGMCIMVLVPFTKEIRLGRLASGQHQLKFMNGDGTYIEKSMVIE